MIRYKTIEMRCDHKLSDITDLKIVRKVYNERNSRMPVAAGGEILTTKSIAINEVGTCKVCGQPVRITTDDDIE